MTPTRHLSADATRARRCSAFSLRAIAFPPGVSFGFGNSQRSYKGIITNTHFRLAEAEQELGLEVITDEALAQMRTALTIEDEEFAIAADHERRVRHDVMVKG